MMIALVSTYSMVDKTTYELLLDKRQYYLTSWLRIRNKIKQSVGMIIENSGSFFDVTANPNAKMIYEQGILPEEEDISSLNDFTQVYIFDKLVRTTSPSISLERFLEFRTPYIDRYSEFSSVITVNQGIFPEQIIKYRHLQIDWDFSQLDLNPNLTEWFIDHHPELPIRISRAYIMNPNISFQFLLRKIHQKYWLNFSRPIDDPTGYWKLSYLDSGLSAWSDKQFSTPDLLGLVEYVQEFYNHKLGLTKLEEYIVSRSNITVQDLTNPILVPLLLELVENVWANQFVPAEFLVEDYLSNGPYYQALVKKFGRENSKLRVRRIVENHSMTFDLFLRIQDLFVRDVVESHFFVADCIPISWIMDNYSKYKIQLPELRVRLQIRSDLSVEIIERLGTLDEWDMDLISYNINPQQIYDHPDFGWRYETIWRRTDIKLSFVELYWDRFIEAVWDTPHLFHFGFCNIFPFGFKLFNQLVKAYEQMRQGSNWQHCLRSEIIETAWGRPAWQSYQVLSTNDPLIERDEAFGQYDLEVGLDLN